MREQLDSTANDRRNIVFINKYFKVKKHIYRYVYEYVCIYINIYITAAKKLKELKSGKIEILGQDRPVSDRPGVSYLYI
jgi:hypothetical protein